MNVFISERQGHNSYITSLIIAYQEKGHKVLTGVENFFFSDFIPDLLHIHWPERFYKWFPLSKSNIDEQYEWIKDRLIWYKENKTKILYTVHNIIPHNLKDVSVDKKFYDLFISHSDYILHHCNKSNDLLINEYPISKSKNNFVAPHGDYLFDYQYKDPNVSKKKYGISSDKFVILNFGSYQPYKGGAFIENVFKKLRIKKKFLLTAGNYRTIENNYFAKLKKQVEVSLKQKTNYKNKKFIFRNIPNEELSSIFSAADIVFIGHNNGLNSGVLNLAATFNKPVVFPDIGCFEEQMKNWEYEKYEVNNIQSSCHAIQNLHEKISKGQTKHANDIWLKENSWNSHVEKILTTIK